MSADLLRRAAAKLRKDTAALPVVWHDRPWFPVFTDSKSLTGVRACRKTHTVDMESDACDLCEYIETYAEGLAGFIALMHPAVALALADVFENLAGCMTTAGACRDQRLEAVAHAVLREDGEQR